MQSFSIFLCLQKCYHTPCTYRGVPRYVTVRYVHGGTLYCRYRLITAGVGNRATDSRTLPQYHCNSRFSLGVQLFLAAFRRLSRAAMVQRDLPMRHCTSGIPTIILMLYVQSYRIEDPQLLVSVLEGWSSH